MTSDGKRSGSKYSPADQLINRRRNSNLIQLVSSCLLEAEADSAPKQAKSKPFLPSLAAPAASNLGNARMVGRHSAGAPPPPPLPLPLEVVGTARHPSRPLPTPTCRRPTRASRRTKPRRSNTPTRPRWDWPPIKRFLRS